MQFADQEPMAPATVTAAAQRDGGRLFAVAGKEMGFKAGVLPACEREGDGRGHDSTARTSQS